MKKNRETFGEIIDWFTIIIVGGIFIGGLIFIIIKIFS